jgi:DNA-binding transcriptional regulator YiaG
MGHNVYIDTVSGREFKRMRQSIGYSQTKLAKEMRVTVRSITRWETGEFPVPRLGELALRFLVLQTNSKKGR